MNMLVSCITEKEGKKVAYVSFEDGNCMAEGMIPDCVITKHKGFTDDEVSQLEDYLKSNLAMLKKQAASVNPIKAMLK